MKYCPECLTEYTDSVEKCVECESAPTLITAEELSKRPGFRRGDEEDTTNFVTAGSADDPYEADAFSTALEEASIPVFVRMRRRSNVDALTTTVQHPWWEILVPEDQLAKAQPLLERVREELKAIEPDAERAAEEEELETEAAAKPQG